MTRHLNFLQLRETIEQAPAIVGLTRTPGQQRPPDPTTMLLSALEPAIREHILARGYDIQRVGNPLARLLTPTTNATISLLNNAIERAAREHRFTAPTAPANPTAQPPAPMIWGEGMRARLTGDLEDAGIGNEHRNHLVELIRPYTVDNTWDWNALEIQPGCNGYTWVLKLEHLAPPGPPETATPTPLTQPDVGDRVRIHTEAFCEDGHLHTGRGEVVNLVEPDDNYPVGVALDDGDYDEPCWFRTQDLEII